MAEKFSQLPQADALTGDEIAAVSQDVDGTLTSVKTSLQDLKNMVLGTPLTVVNGGFEAATDLDGWTITKGSPTAGTPSNNGYANLGPYRGSKFLKHANSDSQDFEVEQEIALVGDRGGALVVTWFGAQTSSLEDFPYIECEFFDASAASLGPAVRESEGAGPDLDTWYRHQHTFTAPDGAVSVKLRAGGAYAAGSITNAGIDEISAVFIPNASGGDVEEAPEDGKAYVRKDGGWVDADERYAVKVLDNLNATTDPTVTDDSSAGYVAGSRWRNTTTQEWFICSDPATGAAVWDDLSLSADDLGSMAVVDDAPDNGNTYAREDGSWALLGSASKFRMDRLPFINLIENNGRFADLASVGVAPYGRELIGAPFKKAYFASYNGSTFSDVGHFIHNNSDFGGSAGNMTPDVIAFLAAMGRDSSASGGRYGIEWYVAQIAAGGGTAGGSFPGANGDLYLMAVGNNGTIFSAGTTTTFCAWVRAVDDEIALFGSTSSIVAEVNGVAVGTPHIISPADGAVLIRYARWSPAGYDTSFPRFYGIPNVSKVQIAMPAIFGGIVDPGVFVSPLASAWSMS